MPGPIDSSYVVLVVDDHADTRDLVTEYLRWRGAYGIRARNARQARAILDGIRVDALVTDFAMPDADGLSVVRWARAQPRFANLPIVLLTGQGSDSIERQARELGAEFLGKPADLERLLETLERLMREPADDLPSETVDGACAAMRPGSTGASRRRRAPP